MKIQAAKFVAAAALAALVSAPAMASADSATVSMIPSQVGKNGTSYLSVNVFDESNAMVSNAKITAKANPSYAVTIGKFYNCASAEGLDVCGKADSELVGLKGSYVAEVKAKETEGKIKIDAYVDTVPYSTELTVGTASVASEPKTVKAAAVTETNEGISEVKAGSVPNGLAYALLGILSAVGFAAASVRRRS